jgi:hypothetical protein
MAANGISTLTYKRARQLAKLELAKADRIARNVVEPGRYAVTDYDIFELPTSYADSDNDTNNVVDHENGSGLLLGRPWSPLTGAVDVGALTLAAGVYERTYDDYFGQLGAGPFDDQATYTTTIVNGGATITAQSAKTSISRLGTVAESTSYTAYGYFLAPATGTFTFYINSDDASYLFVGDSADIEYNIDLDNATVANGGRHAANEESGTFNLVSGEYYKIFAVFGNDTGPGTAEFSYAGPSISKTSDFTGRLFYNTATNGH